MCQELCPRGMGVSASVHVGIHNPPADTPSADTPLGQTTPWADTPLGRHLPTQTPRVYTSRQTATAADDTHSTRMHSCFAEFLQNFSERQILWSLYSVVFHALTSKLPIQTSLSVAPKLPVSLRSGENCPNFSKPSTPQGLLFTYFKW